MQAARRQGYPGLLLQDSLDEKVDYPRTLARLRDSEDYVVDAAPSPILETEPSVLVAIPAYNEARTVGAVVEQAMPYADGALVVDDGSTDETAAVAREAGATVLSHDRNRGYGASLKTAFREAERSNADTLVVLDADSQHDPADVPRLVERLHDGDAGIAVGSRFVADSETDLPVYRLIGIMVVNLLTNLSMGVVRRQSRIGDTQSGFRAYDRSVIESLAAAGTLGNGMGVSTDILHHVHTHNYDIEEVGVTVDYDVENGSKHDPISHGIHLVSNLLRTIERERPVTILGVPGFLSAFVGLGFGYWTFSQFIRSGTFPLGLAVAATFFVLFGVFAAFTAIILHSLNKTFD
jgi:glycosyltransferase involved in cell wall biosynthesis